MNQYSIGSGSMFKNVIIGEVDKVGKRNISGWVSKELDFNDVVRLVISGIFICSHRAEIEDPNFDDRRRFSFVIGERLKKLLTILQKKNAHCAVYGKNTNC